MPLGKVQWFDAQQGVGAIQPDDGSKNVFFHSTSVVEAGLGDPKAGQTLSYDVRQDPGKLAAINLAAV